LQIPFATSGSYPPRAGNLLRPLIDGIPAFRRICEAVEKARHSVFVIVTMLAPDFPMPDGRGSFFDVLDRAVERGLDVRVIFWRESPERAGHQSFSGTAAEREMLSERGSRFRARWDRAPSWYCQHQKSWLIDAGHETETAFVGGINPTRFAVSSPGHVSEGQFHDAYLEVTGPAASDMHHNFVQRWNEASDRAAADGVFGPEAGAPLDFPLSLSAARGDGLVQIQRHIPAGCYSDGTPSPGAEPYDIVAGERSIFEQYGLAIDAARSSIYIENQGVPVPEVSARLEAALKRGVEVAVLLPADPEAWVRAWRREPERRALFDGIEALGLHENFTLAGLAAPNARNSRHNVYVHAKLMLVDDAFGTIGSCNLHAASLFHNGEMNASFLDAGVARALRCELFAEHLGADTSQLDDRAALRLYAEVARRNRTRRDMGDAGWQGLAFALDPVAYGQ
jgi:phosphatidylserine/phosphatidylglycerophosphate/cardiolipin synthase-like enzyme